MKVAVFLFILGAALMGYAWSLPAYKDEKLFLERYMSMSAGQSREYEDLRSEMLTLKFPMQDYGITLLAVASGVFAANRVSDSFTKRENQGAIEKTAPLNAWVPW